MDEQQVDEVQVQELPAEVPLNPSEITDEMDDEADDAAAANTDR